MKGQSFENQLMSSCFTQARVRLPRIQGSRRYRGRAPYWGTGRRAWPASRRPHASSLLGSMARGSPATWGSPGPPVRKLMRSDMRSWPPLRACMPCRVTKDPAEPTRGSAAGELQTVHGGVAGPYAPSPVHDEYLPATLTCEELGHLALAVVASTGRPSRRAWAVAASATWSWRLNTTSRPTSVMTLRGSGCGHTTSNLPWWPPSPARGEGLVDVEQHDDRLGRLRQLGRLSGLVRASQAFFSSWPPKPRGCDDRAGSASASVAPAGGEPPVAGGTLPCDPIATGSVAGAAAVHVDALADEDVTHHGGRGQAVLPHPGVSRRATAPACRGR
jgi:hypothetical protein